MIRGQICGTARGKTIQMTLIIPREAIQVRLTLEKRKHEQFCGNEKIETVN